MKNNHKEELAADGSVYPITINCAYPWEGTNVRQDAKWVFLRKITKKSVDEVKGRNATNRRKAGNVISRNVRLFSCRFGRLRAGHGNTLIDSILERIERADVLLMDIAGRNPNVLFELGCAIALAYIQRKRVFILDEVKSAKDHTPINSDDAVPSDIQGKMFSFYHRTRSKKHDEKYKLVDDAGFRAALNSTIIDLARAKNMWIDPSFTDMEDLTVN